MYQLSLKLKELSGHLSLQKIGVLLSIIHLIVFTVLLKEMEIDETSTINIAIIACSVLIITMSGALFTAIKAVFTVFDVSRRVFPYYFLDILFGFGLGCVAGIIILYIPVLPCVYKMIKDYI